MPKYQLTRPVRSPSRWLPFAALLIAYVIAGKLGLAVAVVHASATPLWAPTGIALAALLLGGARLWPAVFAGAFLVNVTTAGSVATSLGIAAGNSAEALIGAWLARRFARGREAFGEPRTIFAFTLGAGLAAPAVSATVGVSSLLLGGYASPARAGAIWLTWWLGDVAGALVLSPLLIVWAGRRGLADLRARWGEALALLGTAVAAGALVFSGAVRVGTQDAPLAFLCLPPLVWAAHRFGLRGATTALGLLCAIAIHGTLRGRGPFALGDANAALRALKAGAFAGSGVLTTGV